MGYRINYQSAVKYRKHPAASSRWGPLAGLLFLLFLLMVSNFWPEGKEVLQGMFFSGDAAVAAAALEDMTTDLRSGVPFADALEDFCIQVIQESGFAEN